MNGLEAPKFTFLGLELILGTLGRVCQSEWSYFRAPRALFLERQEAASLWDRRKALLECLSASGRRSWPDSGSKIEESFIGTGGTRHRVGTYMCTYIPGTNAGIIIFKKLSNLDLYGGLEVTS
jgi:hypothetical protein